MRHRKSGRHLNRTSSHRQAMFKNMSVSLVEQMTKIGRASCRERV